MYYNFVTVYVRIKLFILNVNSKTLTVQQGEGRVRERIGEGEDKSYQMMVQPL